MTGATTAQREDDGAISQGAASGALQADEAQVTGTGSHAQAAATAIGAPAADSDSAADSATMTPKGQPTVAELAERLRARLPAGASLVDEPDDLEDEALVVPPIDTATPPGVSLPKTRIRRSMLIQDPPERPSHSPPRFPAGAASHEPPGPTGPG